MPILSKPSSAARASLLYITVGALTDVWSGVWCWYLWNHADAVNSSTWYWCIGFLITGFALLVIGLAVGQIGRSARHADLPPPEVTAQVAQAEQNAAARAPVIAPVNPAAPSRAAQVSGVPAGAVAPVAAVPVQKPSGSV